jgi:hypothetical protein
MNRAQQIYLARMPVSFRRKALAPKEERKEEVPGPNAFARFSRLVEGLEEERSLIFDEALDVAAAQAWLNRAYQTVLNRSTSIPNLAEKEEYTKLATVIQAAIPINTATEESVEQNLSILRQQIIIGETDSESLRKLKSHLISSISEVLAPTEQPTSPEGVAAPPEGAEAGGGAPPPEVNPNPALGGGGTMNPNPNLAAGGSPPR